MTVRALAYTYMARMLVFLWGKVKSEYRVVIVLAVFGSIGWEQVRRCRLCTVCKWKRIGQQHKTYTRTHTNAAQHVYIQKMLVTCFSFMFDIHSFVSFPYFIEPRLRVCVSVFVLELQLSCALLLTLSPFMVFASISYRLFCRICVCESFTRLPSHGIYTTLRLYVGFIVLVRPVLWIFVWETYLYVVWSPQY